jgi:hypothetical protein
MAKKSKGPGLFALILIPLTLLVLVLVPVPVMLRVAVFCYLRLNLNEWLSLGIGTVVSFLILFAFTMWVYKKWSQRKKINATVRFRNLKIAGVVLGFYLIYGLIFISGTSAKSAEIRDQYTQLHPILRVATGTMLLFDRSLIITDLARTHDDYEKMGLGKKKKSLHYVQTDGYVHAVDLRTNGRADWKNSFVKLYFEALGFNTLRHIGTADHLHVSLTAKDNLRGI